MPLFHILSETDWKKLETEAHYEPASLATEGFIHLSSREQVEGTLDHFYKGRTDLVILEVHIPENDEHLKWEESNGPNGLALFPHYYGPLATQLIIQSSRHEEWLTRVL